MELNRHIIYWKLSYFNNKTDTAAISAANEVHNADNILAAFTNTTLAKCNMASLTEKQIDENHLSKYKFLLISTKDDISHTPSVEDMKIINTLSQPLLGGLDDRYDDLIDQVKAKPVFDSAGKSFDPVKQISTIKRNKDAALRENGTKVFLHAFNQHDEVFAATLIDIAREENALAKLYGYTDAPAEMYDQHLQLSEASVKQLLDEFALHADILQNYQQMQAQEIKHITGIQQVHSWDMAVPLGYAPEPQDMATASKNILRALSPLGDNYVNHFAYLLNPANGEMDITGGPNRVTEYTGVGYPGMPSTLYMQGFSGELSSMKTLIHEGGHAIHRQLMSDNHIVPSYSSGPNFLFESFAIFNSLLLFDELKDQSNTNSAKAYYIKQFTDLLATELFTSAEEGTFEQKIYDGVAAGSVNNQDDIDSLYAGVMNKYDLFFKNEPERHAEWINKRLMYDDPIYNINYLYAMLVSCKLYELVHLDPKNFAIHYNALLRNGFDASADDLLKKFMGFGLGRKDLIDGALHLMQAKIEELKTLYGK